MKPDSIPIEDRATHTGEHVTFCLPIPQQAGLLGARRVACIGLNCTGSATP